MGTSNKRKNGLSLCKTKLVIFLLALGYKGQLAVAQTVSECGILDEILSQLEPRAKVPWTAALYYQSTQCDFRPAGVGGHGVIIGPTTVLIKGSFMWSKDHNGSIRMEPYSPNHFIIVAGLKSKLPFVADQHTQFIKVANIQPHFLSHDEFSEYDFAIVHLKNPIQFTPFVRPICVGTLPDGILDRSPDAFLNDYLSITGFRSGGRGSRNSVLHMDKEPFGLLPPDFCANKLQWDLVRTSTAAALEKAAAPCGITTTSMEEAIQVRSVIGGSGNGNEDPSDHLRQLLNSTFFETAKGGRPLANQCFHNGAAVVTLYQGKWHLVGIVSESLGTTCTSNFYFVSLVASKNNINWISQNLRCGPDAFICANGQYIHIGSRCNGRLDCVDGSDEERKTCGCLPTCGTNYCLLKKFCRHCDISPTLKVLQQTYTFSTAQTSIKKLCPPVAAPETGINVNCRVSGLQTEIPCGQQHFPGTQAIYSCQFYDTRLPIRAVSSCQEDGKWSNEFEGFQCRPLLSSGPSIIDNENKNWSPSPITQSPEKVYVTDRRNNSVGSTLSIVSPTFTTSTISAPPGTESSKPISFAPDRYKDKNGAPLCAPVQGRKGTEVTCWTSSASKRIPCSEPMSPGSKAEFSCGRYYRPVLSTASVTKHCQPDGDWSLSHRDFECRLDCGIPKKELIGHIVHGRETDGAKWPWHGLIFIDVGKQNLTYICGSTLISKKVLVTAAHCVTDRRGSVRQESLYKVVLAASSNVYHKNILDTEIQIFDVEKIVSHSLFNVANFEADIAIIKLSRPVEVSDYVRPACYPSTYGEHTELKHLSPGSVGTVIGFGYDESGKPSKVLREAGLPVVSYKDCYDSSKIQHSPTQYCAGFTNGTSVCNGDSGSGHFFEEELPRRRYYLQGIVSHGNRDAESRLCDHNQYSVFTKIGAFKNWISETGYELDEDF